MSGHKKRRPTRTPLRRNFLGYEVLRRRRKTPKPTRAEPSSAIEAGSGMFVGGIPKDVTEIEYDADDGPVQEVPLVEGHEPLAV